MQNSIRTELPPHPISKEAQEYLKTFSKKDTELHELAVKVLGSSYFIERTKGFQAWKEQKKSSTP